MPEQPAPTKQEYRDFLTSQSNWGRWGADDQIGTLNFITPEDIVAAARLVRRGRVFAMGIPLDNTGPQKGHFGGRYNPIHTMLATGTDAVAGRFDEGLKLRYADDVLQMPVQAATHWDSLGHMRILMEIEAQLGREMDPELAALIVDVKSVRDALSATVIM